jgi:hypothetical protein
MSQASLFGLYGVLFCSAMFSTLKIEKPLKANLTAPALVWPD